MHPKKLKFNGKVRSFHDKEQLKKFMTTKPTLQRLLIDILERDRNNGNFKNRKEPPNRASN